MFLWALCVQSPCSPGLGTDGRRNWTGLFVLFCMKHHSQPSFLFCGFFLLIVDGDFPLFSPGVFFILIPWTIFPGILPKDFCHFLGVTTLLLAAQSLMPCSDLQVILELPGVWVTLVWCCRWGGGRRICRVLLSISSAVGQSIIKPFSSIYMGT